MWNEIKEKAKFNLLNLYKRLAEEKNAIMKSIPSHDNGSNNQHLNLDIIFDQWKCINQLYIEHGFISIDSAGE